MNVGDIFVIEERPCVGNDIARGFNLNYPLYGVISDVGTMRRNGTRALATFIFLPNRSRLQHWNILNIEIRVIEEAPEVIREEGDLFAPGEEFALAV